MEPLPSRSALVRIGKALAAGTETEDQLDQLDVLLGRCDEVKAVAVDRLAVALASVDLESGGTLWVRGRTKTLVTLGEKLVRMGGHQLPVIRDLAGLRIVGDMTLAEQDSVMVAGAAALGVAEDDVKLIDRRTEPMQGYRALHGEFVVEGIRVELQVRTLLQHEWAEVYERAGDHFGRSIRYAGEARAEVPPLVGDDLPSALREVSALIAVCEGTTFSDERRMLAEVWQAAEATPAGPARQELLQVVHRLDERVETSELQLDHVRQGLREVLVGLSGTLGRLMTKDGP